MIQSNAFESNASANANADESNANASANASAARESSASANANAAFALAFANASAFEHKPAPGGFRGLNCLARLALARERTPSGQNLNIALLHNTNEIKYEYVLC